MYRIVYSRVYVREVKTLECANFGSVRYRAMHVNFEKLFKRRAHTYGTWLTARVHRNISNIRGTGIVRVQV